jgi:hypothetical protein
MQTKDEMLMLCDQLTFYQAVRGAWTRIVSVKPGALDRLPRRNDLRDLLELNRKRFSGERTQRKRPEPGNDIEKYNRS